MSEKVRIEMANLRVQGVRVHADDVSDLTVAGVNFFGPDNSLDVVFPEGTTQQDDQTFLLPGGSCVAVVNGFVTLAWRTW